MTLEWIILIISMIATSIVTWLITYIYYKKQVKQEEELSKKLSKEVKEILFTSYEENLSVLELNRLLEEKTIDKKIGGPLPFKACPKCGNKELKGGTYTDEEHDRTYYIVECKKCNWNDWSQ